MSTPSAQLEDELVASPGRVIAVAGIGVSVATSGDHPNATWKGLLRHGLDRCQEVCGTPDSTLENLRGLLNDPRTAPHGLIGVGQFITDELHKSHPGRLGCWLSDAFSEMKVVDARIGKALAALGLKLSTTNYDDLLEEATGCIPVTWVDKAHATIFLRENRREVLHLHGHYRFPDSVVLGIRSYEEVCKDEFIQTALQSWLMFGTLLFVGCGRGLEDPNFEALLDWTRDILRTVHHSHFMLVRDAELQSWRERLQGLPIVPIVYGAEYSDLVTFLQDLTERVNRRRTKSPFSILRASQTDFDARWDELETSRASIASLEYFQKSRLLAWQLFQAGGRRRAALSFSGRLRSQGTGLLTQEYVEFALDAAEWLLEDEQPSSASTHLAEIQRKTEKMQLTGELLARYHRLRVRCMDAMCNYLESLSAIDEALPNAAAEERSRLEAERAETHFLQGNFDKAAIAAQ